jgi:putative hydrolase of the HAD superfamily
MTSLVAVSTLIFDVDDTLYDVGTGFTAHRNGEIVQQYMVDHLHFSSLAEAKLVREEYFHKYHATAKALMVAQQEGRFPATAPTFETSHLADYWANTLDYTLLGGASSKIKLREQLKECSQNNVTLVAFSNGPRNYVKRVLESLGLFDLFGDERLFAVDDVLPYCKPEPQAFEQIFAKIGNPAPETCVMIEDSMKNIRSAKALGMKTVLVTGKIEDGTRLLPDDKPEVTDPAVDCSIGTIEELPSVLPGLWGTPAVFDPKLPN